MSLRPGIGSAPRRQYLSGLGWYGLRGLGDDSVVPTGSIDTGGTQVDTGGTQPTGPTANPVMSVVGTPMQVLPSAQPTILSTGVAPVGATPQSPLQVQGASTLVVSDGGFLPPVSPAIPTPPAPSKAPLYAGIGLLALAIAAYAWYGNKNVRN
jgi:hypothetical protein